MAVRHSDAGRDYMAWALAIPVRGVKSTGAYKVRFVLVTMCLFVNAEGLAWPGRDRIVEYCPLLSPRDVQTAWGLLREDGLITAVGRVRNATRWRLNAPPLSEL